MPRLHSRSSVASIEAKMSAMASSSICTHHEFRPGSPNRQTHENRTMHYLKIGGGTNTERLPVLLIAGLHAREVAQPPALTNFAEDLITAYNPTGSTRNPLTVARFDDSRHAPPRVYPEFQIPAPVIQRIVERLDLYIAPLCNPDGREFVLSANADINRLWRWNRRPAPASATCAPAPKRVGVDLNRNFNIAWDINTYYSAAAAANAGVSDVHCDETYRGPSAESEPEVLNVQWLIDTTKPKFFADCHSKGRFILYPWAIEDDQPSAAIQNWRNANWDRSGSSGERDGFRQSVSNYGEYFPNDPPERLHDKHIALGRSIRDKIRTKARETYLQPQQSAELDFPFGVWGTPGGADDYAFSRQFVSGGTPPPAYSFTLEFGHNDDHGFHPLPGSTYLKVEREIYSALWALLDYAASWSAPAQSSGCSGCNNCFIATAALDSDVHPDVLYLKRLRDDVLAPTRLGAWFIRSILFVYDNISPPIARFIKKREWLRTIVRRCMVRPVIWQIRKADALSTLAKHSERRNTLFILMLSGLLVIHIAIPLAVATFLWKLWVP